MAADPSDCRSRRGCAPASWRGERLHPLGVGTVSGPRAGDADRGKRLHRRGAGCRATRASARSSRSCSAISVSSLPTRSATASPKCATCSATAFPVPLIMRVRVSPHTGYGSQHSGDPSALFRLFPAGTSCRRPMHSTMSACSTPRWKSNDPVAIIEHVEFYQRESLMPRDERDYCIPFGKAKIIRPGSACTHSRHLGDGVACSESGGKDGCRRRDHRACVASVRSQHRLGPARADSVARTNRVIIAEQVSSGLQSAWQTLSGIRGNPETRI